MALGLPAVVVVVLGASLSTSVLAQRCKSYTSYGVYHSSQTCYIGFCCGTCNYRECCSNTFRRLSEDAQDDCEDTYVINSHSTPVPMIVGIVGSIVALLIFVCCCVCPCCCLYKMCRKPQPVVAGTTHTTVITTTTNQQYPRQPAAVVPAAVVPAPPQPYQAVQYPPYQPMPVQPGYGTQGMPAAPYQGQPFTPGPPPTYQEATGPAYPPQPMPYSQAAYSPGQPMYPLQPTVQPQPPQPPQPQPNVPPAQMDYQAQPAYNPDYVAPPNIK